MWCSWTPDNYVHVRQRPAIRTLTGVFFFSQFVGLKISLRLDLTLASVLWYKAAHVSETRKLYHDFRDVFFFSFSVLVEASRSHA
jgi:hypothetical protein